MRTSAYIALLALLLVSCRRDLDTVPQDGDTPFALQLPVGFPWPGTPPDNPLTTASVQLGKALFFDPRLSRDGTISCASCHLPEKAFSDVTAVSTGIEGRLGERNSPGLANVGYHTSFFRDGGVPTLEQQAIAPIHDPKEMDHDIHAAAALLRDVEPYAKLSQVAYGKPMNGWVITRALANYQRTLISGWSRWDRYMQGESEALTPSELRGWLLFNSPSTGCRECHSDFDLSDHDFHNIGLYQVYADPGRARITLDAADEGKFKTPSLRNVALTAPYMHDGSMATLNEVISHYVSGGEAHPNLSHLMHSLNLTAKDRTDLINFLHALTDERDIDQVP